MTRNVLPLLAAAVLAVPCAAQRTIHAGQTIQGTITESDSAMASGSRFQRFAYDAQAGETITVTMRSGAFDSYLRVGKMDGFVCGTPCAADDDAAGGKDARVQITFPTAGRYLIQASSYLSTGTGPYTLEVMSGAAGSATSLSGTSTYGPTRSSSSSSSSSGQASATASRTDVANEMKRRASELGWTLIQEDDADVPGDGMTEWPAAQLDAGTQYRFIFIGDPDVTHLEGQIVDSDGTLVGELSADRRMLRMDFTVPSTSTYRIRLSVRTTYRSEPVKALFFERHP